MNHVIDWLRELTEATAPLWQWSVVFLAGAIPFVESYFGSALGIIAGVKPPIAIIAAIIGNVASMFLLVTLAARVRRVKKTPDKPMAPRQEKLKRAFDKYGIAGVSLLGQTILPSQLTSMAMVAFGANTRAVVLWQTVSIILWGVTFGVLATLGVNALIPVGA